MNIVKLDQNRIILIHDDCLHAMRAIKPNSIDMVFADLPYGTTNCKWDTPIDLNVLWSLLLGNRFNTTLSNFGIVRDYKTLVFTASQPFTTHLSASNIQMLKYAWIWKKTKPTGFLRAKNMPMKDYEDIPVFSNGVINHPQQTIKRMVYNPIGVVKRAKPLHITRNTRGFSNTSERLNQTDDYLGELTGFPKMVLEFSNIIKNPIHPTQKPIELLEYLIETYTSENDIVLDPTFGSCTTGVACINLNRRFIGIEKDPIEFEKGLNRIQNELRLRDETTPQVPATRD